MESFSKKEALSFAFDTLKGHFWRITGLLFLINLVVFALQIISEEVKMPLALLIIYSVVTWVVGVVASMGFIRFCLAYADNREGNFSDIYSCYPLFWKYLASSLLYGLIVFGGMILLIIPGIIWAYKFFFSQYLVIDKGLSPIAALKESSRITKGHKWNLFIFSLIFVALLIIAMVPFILMAVASSPLLVGIFLGASVPSRVAIMISAIILYMLFIIVFSAFSALSCVYVYRRLLTMNIPSSIPTINPGLSIDQSKNRPTL